MKKNVLFLIASVCLFLSACFNGGSTYSSNSEKEGENWVECENCEGRGYFTYKCSKCDGFGSLYDKIVVDETASCPTCHGGKTICKNCFGHGRIPCEYCSSRGQIICKECSGNGYTVTFFIDEYIKKDCWKCHGSGRDICYHCNGDGDNMCKRCFGDGYLQCPTCGRYGNEHITHEEIIDLGKCSKCNGSGKVREECPECDGEGKIKVEQ